MRLKDKIMITSTLIAVATLIGGFFFFRAVDSIKIFENFDLEDTPL